MSPRKTRLPGELAFAGLLLLFSLFMLWQAYLIAGFESPSSAGVFPMFAALTMTVTGLIILDGTRRAAPEASAAGEGAWQLFRRRVTPRVLLLFTGLIVAYMAALEPVGFLPASFVFLVASMFLLGSRRVLFTLVVSAASLALVYGVFQTVFSVVLPKGRLLAGWLW